MGVKKYQRGKIGVEIEGDAKEEISGEAEKTDGETKKLAILVIFMSTAVLALYGIIPFI